MLNIVDVCACARTCEGVLLRIWEQSMEGEEGKWEDEKVESDV